MNTPIKNVAATVCIFLATTAVTQANLIITYNPGGVVDDFYRAVESHRMRGERIIVDGGCYSACTLVLALARDNLVCATRRASFHFHRPYSGAPGTAAYDDDGGLSEVWQKEMPVGVAAFIAAHGGLTHEWIVLSGQEMQTLVPMCSNGTAKPVGEPKVLRHTYN